MNVLDFIVIGIVFFFVAHCYIKGFVIAVYNFVSFAASVYLTKMFYPGVSKAIRGNPAILEKVKVPIQEALGFRERFEPVSQKAESELLASLQLPDFVRDTLLENNSAAVYTALNVDSFEDYIVGFIANAVINAACMILVFAAVYALMKIAGMVIDIVSRLPVINTVNKLVGAVLGLIEGTVVAWAVLAAAVWFFAASQSFPINDYLRTSFIAKYFHDTNFILKLVTDIFI